MDASSLPPQLRSGSPGLFRRVVGLSLLSWRRELDVPQRDAAERIGRTTQQISLIECGDRLPAVADLEILLGFYGKDENTPFMRELVEAGKKAKSWWTALSGVVPKWFDAFLALESGATDILSFDPVHVPGLLQTSEYAEAVLHGNPDFTEDQVRQAVELRLSRQRILDREEEPVRIWAVLDESVLHRTRGGPEVMRAQLDHLLTMSKRPGVDVQVLPSCVPTPYLDAGAFVVMRLPSVVENAFDVAYLEPLPGAKFVDKPEDVLPYQEVMDRLRALAADPDRSRAIIRKVMKEVN